MKPNAAPKLLNLHGVRFPREAIQQHLLIAGASGSGKSHGLIKPLLIQLLAQGDAAAVFDPKGDLLPIVQDALKRCGRSKDLVTIGAGEQDHTFNPLQHQSLSPNQIANQLISISSLTGQSASQRSNAEDLFWSTARLELITVMIELARVSLAETGETLHFGHIQKLRRQLVQPEARLRKWSAETRALLSEAGADGLIEFAGYPENTRACVLASASNLLAPFFRPPLSLLTTPTPGRPAVHLRDLFDRSRVVVISVANAEHALDLWPGFLLLKQALYKLILSRPRLPIRQDNHLVVCLDEYNRLITAHDGLSSEHVVMEAARSSKTSFILAAQNLSGLEMAGGSLVTDKLAALTSNVCFLANSCPATARLAERVLGTRKTMERHRSVIAVPPPPLLFPTAAPTAQNATTGTTLVPVEKPVLSPAKLSRLKTGQGYLKLVDGKIHRLQCSFD